jgi:(S)-2-hydroxy-acid oxidase
LNWDIVGDLRSITDKKIVLKGIVTAEDAERCLQHGVDGIIVSNHGGRSETSNWGSLDSLPEVVQTIDGQIPVLIDGGFRYGMDIFKALALGADAICIGRPYLWGLAAFGQAGVEQVLQLLTHEFRMAIMSAGARSLEEIKPSHLGRV